MSPLYILTQVANNPEADIVFTGDDIGEFVDMVCSGPRPLFGGSFPDEGGRYAEDKFLHELRRSTRIIGRKNSHEPGLGAVDIGAMLGRVWSAEYPDAANVS